ncbi:MAG: hypothetical protein WAR79_17535 [Melioribacteraceae bacterium]
MSKYGVFIIESLRSGDYFDGESMSQILELSSINNFYREVISKEDFIKAINEFKNSNFRYLHLSCHSDMEGIEINGENISNYELSILLKNKITRKLIFLSACQGSNRMMASALIIKCGGQSLIGTPVDLSFDKAALFWPSFYHVINNLDKTKMNKQNLDLVLKRCVDLFEIPINYYHGIKDYPDYLRRYKFRSNKRTSNNKISAAKKL